MIAAPVQCDVDGIPKGSHYVRVPPIEGRLVGRHERPSNRSTTRPYRESALYIERSGLTDQLAALHWNSNAIEPAAGADGLRTCGAIPRDLRCVRTRKHRRKLARRSLGISRVITTRPSKGERFGGILDTRVAGREVAEVHLRATADNLRAACQPQLTRTLASVSEGWSGYGNRNRLTRFSKSVVARDFW